LFRLCLPSKVIENGEESADYDSKSGNFLIKVPKLNVGQHFEGLDLLTKLLTPNTKQITKRPLIEVINEEQTTSDSNHLIESIDEEFEWHFEQTLRQESDDLLLCGEKYGFANEQTGIIARLAEDFSDLIDVKDPEHKSSSQKRCERLESESMQFSDDHYLSDLFDQKEIISQLISFEADWDKCEISYKFNEEEKFKMKNLPKKEYIFDKAMKKTLLLGMIDILFAYAYDMRINECEHNVESAWNICKLSATLSWFETYCSLNQVVISLMRRSLCYPLYRNWQLSLKVLQDIKRITRLGPNYILKCFLDIHKLLNESGDGRYILNDLYITDYCVWLQYVKATTFDSLAKALEVIQINKNDVNLDLDLLERAAYLALEENKCTIDSQNKELFLKRDMNFESNCDLETNSDDSQSLIHETSSENSSDTSDTSSLYTDCSEKEKSESDSEDDFPSSNDENSNDSNDSDDDSSSSDSEDVSSNVAMIDKEIGRCR
jgi:protein SHQ1